MGAFRGSVGTLLQEACELLDKHEAPAIPWSSGNDASNRCPRFKFLQDEHSRMQLGRYVEAIKEFRMTSLV